MDGQQALLELAPERPVEPQEAGPTAAPVTRRDRTTRLSRAVRRIAPIVALGLSVYFLLPQVARGPATYAVLRHAAWPWIAVAIAASAATYLAAATGWLAASPVPLDLRRTCGVQLAAAAANRVTPAGLGGMTTNIAYLRRAGATRAEAITTTAVNSGAKFVIHVVALLAIVPLLGGTGRFGLSPPDLADHWTALIAVAATLCLMGLLSGGPWLLRRFRPAMVEAIRTLGRVIARPGRPTAVLTAAASAKAAYVAALFAAVRAYSPTPSLLTIAVIYLGASAAAAAAPTPGGLGALDAALVAGLGAAGTSAPRAVAAVLTYRTITYWLPVIPGIAAHRCLRRRGVL